MSSKLLLTKFKIPPLRESCLPRGRLTALLNTGLERKLTLVSAPAGYGKSTLLSRWARQLEQPAAWLSLDKGDDNPGRFWSYLLGALGSLPGLELGSAGEALLEWKAAGESESWDFFLTPLISEMAGCSERSVLVLDDLHLVEAPQIHDGLVFLLGHLPQPGGLHLAVASRSDPPWPLARMRVRGELNELRARDLCFSSEEATRFIHSVTGRALSVEQIALLEQRTEGWVAGYQMAALSIKGRRDIAGFLEGFSGSHRYVLDYLMDEVLSQQEPKTLDFLLKTSILQRLSASLCDAVTESGESQTTLMDLERSNMFLVPLDDERLWYRYHSLFGDLLQKRLEQTAPGLKADLHRRASTWYEKNGLIVDSVSHALEAGEMAQVVRLVEANAFTILDLGGLTDLLRCLEEIPGSVRFTRPWLGIAYAWVLVYLGRRREAEQALAQAEEVVGVLEGIERKRAAGQIRAIHAYGAWIQGDGNAARSWAHQALDELPEGELTVRAITAQILGGALVQCNDLEGGLRFQREAMELARTAGNMHIYIISAASLAYGLTLQGRLQQAESVCRETLVYAQEQGHGLRGQSPAIAQIYAMLSTVLLAWNQVDRALAYAQEGLALDRHWAQADTLTVTYIYLADAWIARGDLDQAAATVAQARRVGGHVSDWFRLLIGGYEARLALEEGDLASAVRWAAESGLDTQDEVAQPLLPVYAMLARIRLAEGRAGQGLGLLDRLIAQATRAGATGTLVRLLCRKAVALEALGEEKEALAALEQALGLAEGENQVRPFVDKGEVMAGLLRRALEGKVQAHFARRLLAEMSSQAEGLGEPAAERRVVEVAGFKEALSGRELEVLRLLNSSLSIPEIAGELTIAPSTARTHVRNIYSKLAVHGRIEAIHRAQELGLL